MVHTLLETGKIRVTTVNLPLQSPVTEPLKQEPIKKMAPMNVDLTQYLSPAYKEYYHRRKRGLQRWFGPAIDNNRVVHVKMSSSDMYASSMPTSKQASIFLRDIKTRKIIRMRDVAHIAENPPSGWDGVQFKDRNGNVITNPNKAVWFIYAYTKEMEVWNRDKRNLKFTLKDVWVNISLFSMRTDGYGTLYQIQGGSTPQHPHLFYYGMCQGTYSSDFSKMIKRGDIRGLLRVLLISLKAINPENHYQQLWRLPCGCSPEGHVCITCGRQVCKRNDHNLYSCLHYCIECGRNKLDHYDIKKCRSCGRVLCDECATITCDHCNTKVCKTCLILHRIECCDCGKLCCLPTMTECRHCGYHLCGQCIQKAGDLGICNRCEDKLKKCKCGMKNNVKCTRIAYAICNRGCYCERCYDKDFCEQYVTLKANRPEKVKIIPQRDKFGRFAKKDTDETTTTAWAITNNATEG